MASPVPVVDASGPLAPGHGRRHRAGMRALRPGPVPAAIAVAVCGLLAGCGGDSPTGVAPPASLEELFGDTLYRADSSRVGIDALQDAPLIGIYFAAHACSACASFTPLLLDAYRELRATDRAFEVVLVSGDPTEAAMFTHMTDREMPWLALPWQGRHALGLVDRYGVRWIPTLIIVDGDGATVSVDGRDEIAASGAAAGDAWLEASG